MLRAFVRNELPGLRRQWPSRCVDRSDDDLLAELTEAAELAVSHGITGDRSLASFLHLRLMLGPRFPASPRYAWAAAILDDPSLGGREKIARIHMRILGRD